MILPASYSTSLLILVLSTICWGTWANTQKLAGQRRYELYNYDFVLGFLAAAVAAAFTFGSLNTGDLTFQENFLIASYRSMAWAVGAGVVFAIGNVFLTATVSVSGLTVAFPVSLGMAVVVGTAWDLTTGNVQKGALLAISGILLVLMAIIVVAYAYGSHLDRLLAAVKQPAFRPDPRVKMRTAAPKPSRQASAAQAIVLGIISGFGFGFVKPMVENARAGENGVAPYGLALLFGGGMLVMTVVMTPFLFNFPVSGEPLGIRHLFSGTGIQHLYGILGGVLAGVAVVAGFVVAAVPAAASVPKGMSYALAQGSTVLAALWGLLAWKEFGSASARIRTLFAVVLILFALGVGMLSIALA